MALLVLSLDRAYTRPLEASPPPKKTEEEESICLTDLRSLLYPHIDDFTFPLVLERTENSKSTGLIFHLSESVRRIQDYGHKKGVASQR